MTACFINECRQGLVDAVSNCMLNSNKSPCLTITGIPKNSYEQKKKTEGYSSLYFNLDSPESLGTLQQSPGYKYTREHRGQNHSTTWGGFENTKNKLGKKVCRHS